MSLHHLNYFLGQVLELCPESLQTPHLKPSTYSKCDLSMVVLVFFFEFAGLPRFLTTTNGSMTCKSGVSNTSFIRAIKLPARGFPLSRISAIFCIKQLRSQVSIVYVFSTPITPKYHTCCFARLNNEDHFLLLIFMS